MFTLPKKVINSIINQREEILKAFIAKWGYEPDEVEQVHKKLHYGDIYYIRKRENVVTNDKFTWGDVSINGSIIPNSNDVPIGEKRFTNIYSDNNKFKIDTKGNLNDPYEKVFNLERKEKKRLLIIGLIGKSQAGKTTAADFAVENCNKIDKLSFATPLKLMVEKAKICGFHELFEEKTWFSRTMLQLIGTNLIREQINPDFWIDKMKEQINTCVIDADTIIIDDVRFKNEAEFIRNEKGILIRIRRPSLISNDSHRSENEQEEIDANFTIINDNTLLEYKKDVLSVINNTLERRD